MIHIEVNGANEISAKLAALPESIRQQAVTGLAQEAYDAAFRLADKHNKTGSLIRSLHLRPIGDGWEVYHDLQQARHALFVHWGTRAHPIAPNRKKVLRWPSGSGSRTGFAFARFVKHPGYKGDPWLVKAGEEAVSAFDHIVPRIQGGL